MPHPMGWEPLPQSLIPPRDRKQFVPSGLADVEGWGELFNQAKNAGNFVSSPLVLDLDGDGIETINSNFGVYFDHDANGFSELTSWVDSDDGLLVWDRNADGRISSGKELFGSETILFNQAKAENGFAALAELDSNFDGKFDSGDLEWGQIRIWRDVNGDGVSGDGELSNLFDAGIQSIDVSYLASNFVDDNGNEHRQIGSFTRSDNSTGLMADVWFDVDLKYTVAHEIMEIPAEFIVLPELESFGNLYSLQQAMVRDGGGVILGLLQDFMGQTNIVNRNEIFEQLLFRWTDSYAIDPLDRPGFDDARKLGVVEKFVGESFVGIAPPTVSQIAEVLLRQAYSGIYEFLYSQLMMQTHLKPLYNLISYAWDAENEQLVAELEDVRVQLSSMISADATNGELVALEFIRAAKGMDNLTAFPLDQLRDGASMSWLLDSYGMQKTEGTEFDDTLSGVAEVDNAIRGGEGNDVIDGVGGRNVLYGDGGNDVITGGVGDDIIYGGDGDDILSGGDGGTDMLFGGAGNDTLGTGNSNYWDYHYGSPDVYDGGEGNDTLYGVISADGEGYGDLYYFKLGDGQDVIYEAAGGIAINRIMLSSEITPDDVIVSRNDLSLVISFTMEQWGQVLQSNIFLTRLPSWQDH